MTLHLSLLHASFHNGYDNIVYHRVVFSFFKEISTYAFTLFMTIRNQQIRGALYVVLHNHIDPIGR